MYIPSLVCVYSVTPCRGFRGCVLSLLLTVPQCHTPVSDELYQILTRHIFDIFTLCKDPLLSRNATQGGVNILTWVSELASCLTNASSPAWLGACDGVAVALLWRFNQEGGRRALPLQELKCLQPEGIAGLFGK